MRSSQRTLPIGNTPRFFRNILVSNLLLYWKVSNLDFNDLLFRFGLKKEIPVSASKLITNCSPAFSGKQP